MSHNPDLPAMEGTLLSTLSELSFSQKKYLNNGIVRVAPHFCIYCLYTLYRLSGRILTVSDLLLTAPTEAAKKCKLSLMEIQSIMDIICKERTHNPRSLAHENVPRDGESFTTGDVELDSALGGGVRTGMIWEIVGQRYCHIPFRQSSFTQLCTIQCCRKVTIWPAAISHSAVTAR